jgi:hypothetical protein
MGRVSPARRERLRARAREVAVIRAAALADMRATGASCATCVHFKRRHSAGDGKYECEAGSESGGWYQPAKADGLCVEDYKAR